MCTGHDANDLYNIQLHICNFPIMFCFIPDIIIVVVIVDINNLMTPECRTSEICEFPRSVKAQDQGMEFH